MRIEELTAPPGAKKKRKRVGRGMGSGHGKTSGRGHKGSLARSGKGTWLGFEGGQMPLIRRIPKRGFISKSDRYFQIVNIGQLQLFDGAAVVTAEELLKRGLIKKKNVPVKLLGKGELKKALKISLSAASRGAEEKIKAAGGEFQVIKNVKGAH